MIHFDAVDFSERRSEEVVSFLMLRVFCKLTKALHYAFYMICTAIKTWAWITNLFVYDHITL